MSGATHTRAVVAMSLGGLLFGFDTAVISGVTDAPVTTLRGWNVAEAQVARE